MGMDQRGFGLSKGRRGIVEGKEIIRDDALLFAQKVTDKYGGAGVPHFCIGNSLGGAINFLALTKAPDTFQAASFIAPFTGLGGDVKRQMTMIKPIAKIISYFAPTYRV